MTVPDIAPARELAHRYAAAVDEGRIEEAVALFTSEAVLHLPDPPRHLEPVAAHHGHAEIRSALGTVLSLRATVHEITGQVLEPIAEGHLRGRTTCAAHHFLDPREASDTARDLVWRVRYDDEYVECAGRWLIASRRMTVIAVGVYPVRAVHPR